MKEKTRKITLVVAIVLAAVTLFGVVSALFTPMVLTTEKPKGSVNVGEVGTRASDYALLYVKEGLIANYIGDAETLSAGTRVENGYTRNVYYWKNWVEGGASAVLTMPERWQAMKGGIGYSLTLETWGLGFTGCELPESLSLDYADMPSYQIELVAAFTGVTDENGKIAFTSKNELLYGLYNQYRSTFRFGAVHAFSTVTESDGSGNFFNRWYVCNEAYNMHGANPSPHYCGMLYLASSNQERIVYNNELLGRPVYMTVSRYGNVAYPSVYVDYSLYGSNPNTNILGSLGTEFSVDAWTSYESAQYIDQAAPFSVLNDYPGILYGIRVYNRTLTEEEGLQNFFVDMCRYYGVNVSKMMRLSAEEFAAFAAECGNDLKLNGITMRETSYDADRVKLIGIINDNWEE